MKVYIMNNEQILEQIRENKKRSIAYQRLHGISGLQPIDEMGGHVGYALQEEQDHLCPSDEYMTSLFEECAAGLGFKYEQR